MVDLSLNRGGKDVEKDIWVEAVEDEEGKNVRRRFW